MDVLSKLTEQDMTSGLTGVGNAILNKREGDETDLLGREIPIVATNVDNNNQSKINTDKPEVHTILNQEELTPKETEVKTLDDVEKALDDLLGAVDKDSLRSIMAKVFGKKEEAEAIDKLHADIRSTAGKVEVTIHSYHNSTVNNGEIHNTGALNFGTGKQDIRSSLMGGVTLSDNKLAVSPGEATDIHALVSTLREGIDDFTQQSTRHEAGPIRQNLEDTAKLTKQVTEQLETDRDPHTRDHITNQRNPVQPPKDNQGIIRPVDETVKPIPEDEPKKPKEVVPEDVTESAEAVLAEPLSPETKAELDEAGKSKEGFMYSITRIFKGETWKRWIPTVIGATGSVATPALAGWALASGPIGAAIFGGAVIGLGVYTGVKTIRNVIDVANRDGISFKDMLKDPKTWFGVIAGTAIAGATRAGAALVPGFGYLAKIGIDGIVSGAAEKYLNNSQSKLLERLMNEFELRRYTKLKEEGHLVRGADGKTAVNVDKILDDIDAKITPNEKKTAVKAAIATLSHLFATTKDEKYKYFKYKGKDGKEVKVDVTTLKIQKGDGSTDAYLTLEFDPKNNIESYIDNIDTKDLVDNVRAGWNSMDHANKEKFTNEIITYFVGIESGDVDKILSEERKAYLSAVHFTTGLQTSMGMVNAISAVFGGFEVLSSATGQVVTSTSDAEVAKIQDQYQTTLNDPNSTVEIQTLSNGDTLDIIRLDGDNMPDLVYDNSIDQFIVVSDQGAEKLFELQNPNLGDVKMNTFAANTSDIRGTLTDASGKVVGITYFDSSDNIGVMPVSELQSHLSASGSQTVTLSEIAPDGSVTLNLNGNDYQTNISTFAGIGTESIVTGGEVGSLTVQGGDSMPRMMYHVLDQARTLNPNLPTEGVELEKMMYTGAGITANDLQVAEELGLVSPDAGGRAPLAPGDEFNWSKSPTIMGWLQELNGGTPINLGSTATQPGTSSVVTFTGTPVAGVPMNDVVVPGYESTSGLNTFGAIAGGLGGTVVGFLAALKGGSDVGGITRQVKVAPLQKTDDKKVQKDDKVAPTKETSAVATVESKEAEDKRIKEILAKQILPNVRIGRKVRIDGVFYEKDESGNWLSQSKVDKKIKEISSDEQVADLIFKQKEVNRLATVAMILNLDMKRETVLKFDFDGKTVEYKIDVKVDSSKGKKKEYIVTWINQTDPKDVKKSIEIATMILKKSDMETVIGTSDTKNDGSKPGDPIKPGESTAAATVESQEAQEAETTLFGALQSMLNQLHTEGTNLVVGGNIYRYNEANKTWMFVQSEASKTKIKEVKIAPQVLSDSQVIEQWMAIEDTKTLSNELEINLFRIPAEKRVRVGKNIYRKIETVVSPERYTLNNSVYVEDTATHIWKKIEGANAKETYTADEMKELAIRAINPAKLTPKKTTTLWKSSEKSFDDKGLAAEIASLKEKSKTAKAVEKNAESTAEKEKSKEVEDSKGRKFVKGALKILAAISGAVTGGMVGTAFATTPAGIPIGIAAVAGLVAIDLGETAAEKAVASRIKDQKEILEMAKDGKKLTEEQNKKLEDLNKREKRAQKILDIIKATKYFTVPFAISLGINAIFGPAIESLLVSVKMEGALNILRTLREHVPMGGKEFNFPIIK